MPTLAKYSQTYLEDKRYAIEYSDWLDTGETISSVTFGVTPTTQPPFGVQTHMIENGTRVNFFVAGGVADENYTLVVTIQTSGGQVKQDTVLFAVRSV